MADIVAARAAVQKAVAFLVNRFGHDSDVFAHLSLALDNLRDEPAPRVVEVAPEPEPEPIEEIEEVVSEAAPPLGPEPAPKPRKSYRRNRY